MKLLYSIIPSIPVDNIESIDLIDSTIYVIGDNKISWDCREWNMPLEYNWIGMTNGHEATCVLVIDGTKHRIDKWNISTDTLLSSRLIDVPEGSKFHISSRGSIAYRTECRDDGSMEYTITDLENLKSVEGLRYINARRTIVTLDIEPSITKGEFILRRHDHIGTLISILNVNEDTCSIIGLTTNYPKIIIDRHISVSMFNSLLSLHSHRSIKRLRLDNLIRRIFPSSDPELIIVLLDNRIGIISLTEEIGSRIKCACKLV